MVYTYNGILCSLKKEILTPATTWMNLEDIRPRETSQSQKDKYRVILLISGTQSSQIHRGRVTWWVPGAGERGEGELVFKGDRVSVWEEENSSGDLLHNDVNVPKATELYT